MQLRRSSVELGSGDMGRKHRPDHGLLIVSLIMTVLGLIVVYAISPALAAQAARKGQIYDSNYFVLKQGLAIILGLVAFFITFKIPIRFWQKVRYQLIALGIVASFIAIFVTKDVNGASRWIQLGGLSFQPAELVKYAIIILVATYLSELIRSNGSITERALKPFIFGLVAIGFLIAGIQGDLGSTGVMVMIMGAMLLAAGAPLKRIMVIVMVVVAGGVLLIASTPYRRDRLDTFLHPGKDCKGSGYHACEALVAVGSGGPVGLQLGRSVQAYGYLPEAANDSIFAVYAETFGFIGSTILLLLYGALFVRILRIAQRSPSTYVRLICIGVFAWLSTQAAINIGAMIGLLPLKGITLPFISYGGTSIVFVMAGLGLVFQASQYTVSRLSSVSANREGGSHEYQPSIRRDGRGQRGPRYAVSRSQ